MDRNPMNLRVTTIDSKEEEGGRSGRKLEEVIGRRRTLLKRIYKIVNAVIREQCYFPQELQNLGVSMN